MWGMFKVLEGWSSSLEKHRGKQISEGCVSERQRARWERGSLRLALCSATCWAFTCQACDTCSGCSVSPFPGEPCSFHCIPRSW